MKTIYFLDFALNRGGAEISLENLVYVLKNDYRISLIQKLLILRLTKQ